MGSVAEVLSFTRTSDDSGQGADVHGDLGGGDLVTAQHFADCGDDSQPFPGDFVATNEAPGHGNEQVTGYIDPLVTQEAGPGEKRIYSRSAPGVVAAVIWLKADGTVVVTNELGAIEMAPDGDVTINGVVIDVAGNISTPGTIQGLEVSNAAVSLGTHVHTSAAPGSPTGPATSPPPP